MIRFLQILGGVLIFANVVSCVYLIYQEMYYKIDALIAWITFRFFYYLSVYKE